MNLPEEIIQQIAEEITCGMECYLHPGSLELETVPGDSYDTGALDEKFAGEYNDIFRKITTWDQTVHIVPMSSRESFRVMEQFIEECIPGTIRLKADLLEGITRRYPFRRFRSLIDTSEYRQAWFDYRGAQMVRYVKETLEWTEPKQFTMEDFEHHLIDPWDL